MCWIEALQPLREQPDHAEARCPGLSACSTKALLPLKEQVGADVLGALTFGKSDEAPQHSLRRPQVPAKAAADPEVAIERKPSMSSLV